MSEQSLVSDGPVLGKDDPVLRAEGLEKRFGGLVATDDASIEVERGTITGLIGPNGAGKSTLFNLVSGFYEPDAGSVSVNGVDVTGQKPHAIADQGMIRTFQTPRKPEGMTVREALLVDHTTRPGNRLSRCSPRRVPSNRRNGARWSRPSRCSNGSKLAIWRPSQQRTSRAGR